MTLGYIIFLCVLAQFCRRMRAKRAKCTAEFAVAKNIDSQGVGWRAKLGSLFSRGPQIPKEDKVALTIEQLRNPQRVAILQGPVAVRRSIKKDEPIKEMLDNIGLTAKVLERYYGGDESKIPAIDYLGAKPAPVPLLPWYPFLQTGNEVKLTRPVSVSHCPLSTTGCRSSRVWPLAGPCRHIFFQV